MVSVIEDLDQWGPESKSAVPTLTEAQSYCRKLATSHYENFPVVSWLLPKHLHQHFYNVYAYCRWADDLGDETGSSAEALSLLEWWQTELKRCYQGDSAHPVFVALKPTIEQFSIPQEPFENLISAFIQDQSVHHYDTFEQLKLYCQHSANPVGRIVLSLCGVVTEQNVQLSDSICTGLQLANFWQDVARDAEIGRTYLPTEDRQQFNYTDTDLRNRVYNCEFKALMQFEVTRARELLLAGMPLVNEMPGRIKLDIELFIRGGLEILNAIEKIDYNVWRTRPTVNKRKLMLQMIGSGWKLFFSRS